MDKYVRLNKYRVMEVLNEQGKSLKDVPDMLGKHYQTVLNWFERGWDPPMAEYLARKLGVNVCDLTSFIKK